MTEAVIIYTDGACSGNPGPGGWGAIMRWKGKEKELSGGTEHTTNNRMELMAVIESLSALKRWCDVIIYTDSTYVMKGAIEWMPGWKQRGWKTSNKKPVENKDLWEALDFQLNRHNVNFRWVKGHSGDEMNERADKLAVAAIPGKNKNEERA